MPDKTKKRPSMAEALSPGAGGLLALFETRALESRQDAPGSEMPDVRELPLVLIEPNPRQSRQVFDIGALQELAESIRQHGVIEPIVVRPTGARYEIVAGERRYRAAGMAEQTSIPARIMALDAEQAAIITAIENLQREDLDIEDEARQFAYLLEVTGLSQRKLAAMLGVNHIYLSRRVKLLKRPDILEEYRSGRMKLHDAIASIDDGSEDDAESVSQGNSEDDVVLIEREDLPGYIVSRGKAGSAQASNRTPFRWRPATQFRTWLTRITPEQIPPDERASFKVQIKEIKSKLDEWERSLEEWEQAEHRA
jgi:ParB family chromosome partitioning protein